MVKMNPQQQQFAENILMNTALVSQMSEGEMIYSDNYSD